MKKFYEERIRELDTSCYKYYTLPIGTKLKIKHTIFTIISKKTDFSDCGICRTCKKNNIYILDRKLLGRKKIWMCTGMQDANIENIKKQMKKITNKIFINID